MTDDVLPPVTPLGPAAPAAQAPAKAPDQALPFERLMDSLRRLAEARPRAAAPGEPAGTDTTDVESLQQALRAADDGFVTAMDLRQRLEAAFRAHRP